MFEEENEFTDFELDRIFKKEAILSRAELLFSETIEIEDFPEDYYQEKTVNGKKVRILNEKKYIKGVSRNGNRLLITKRIDRRSKTELKRLITRKLEVFSLHPDNKAHILKKDLLEKLTEFQTELCPNWEQLREIEERELYYDFETYKEALEEVIPEVEEETTVVTEVKDKRQSTSKPKNDVRLKALMDILPEFVKQIEKIDGNKEEKGKLIELITGVNPTDAYKKVCTGVKLNITTKEQERIDLFKAMIEQISDKK